MAYYYTKCVTSYMDRTCENPNLARSNEIVEVSIPGKDEESNLQKTQGRKSIEHQKNALNTGRTNKFSYFNKRVTVDDILSNCGSSGISSKENKSTTTAVRSNGFYYYNKRITVDDILSDCGSSRTVE